MAQDTISMAVIARIHTDFPTKFGVPRQSGLVEALEATVVFEPEYRIPEAVRGLEEFSHIWLIWQFSQSRGWSPTVRPPRLGGNRRLGVFATRSPFRPNPIGLSSVRLTGIERHPALGPVLHVAGADLVDGTPILDIKPYIPYGDCHPDAAGGFTDRTARQVLEVVLEEPWRSLVPPQRLDALTGVLAQDPRPSYQHDSSRVYGLGFAGLDVRFTVDEGVLTVVEILPEGERGGEK